MRVNRSACAQRFAGAVLLLTLAFASALQSPAFAGAQERPDLIISITPVADRLDAIWTFAEPVSQYAFSGFEAERLSRLADWTIQGEDWVFDGDVLQRADGSPFDSFRAEIGATTTLRARGYAIAARIGGRGWVIHTGGLAPRRNDQFEIVFPDLRPDEVIIGAGRDGARRAGPVSSRDFIYIGPASQAFDEKIRIIRAQDPAIATLYGAFQSQLSVGYDRLSERLGDLSEAPIVSLSYRQSTEQRGVKGSVDGLFIALNVIGHEPEAFTALAEGDLSILVNHELFHLWNGRDAHRGRAPAPSWMVEGGAEYVAALLIADRDLRARQIETRINQCLIAIGPRSITDSPLAQRGRTPYACGAAVMVFVDAGVRQAGTGDILTVWEAMLSAAGLNGGYGLDDLTQSVADLGGDPALATLAAILDGWDSTDTPDFQGFLRGAGVEVSAFDPSAGEDIDLNLSVDVLRAMVRSACGAGFSVSAAAQAITLTPAGDCGPALNGPAQISFLNGIDLTRRPRAAFEAARLACQTGEQIMLAGPHRSGEAAGAHGTALDCPPSIMAHPGLFEITELGRLSDSL